MADEALGATTQKITESIEALLGLQDGDKPPFSPEEVTFLSNARNAFYKVDPDDYGSEIKKYIESGIEQLNNFRLSLLERHDVTHLTQLPESIDKENRNAISNGFTSIFLELAKGAFQVTNQIIPTQPGLGLTWAASVACAAAEQTK